MLELENIFFYQEDFVGLWLSKKSRFLSQKTRKMDCSAKYIMRDVVFFTGFKVSNSS